MRAYGDDMQAMMRAVDNFVTSSTTSTLEHVQILHNGPWATLASLSFLTAALMGGDLLALRAALLMAYVFNLINGLTGVPTWPYVDWEGRVNVDMVFWAAAAGFLHGYSVLRMLLDEVPVKFGSDDEEQLVKFFNRRSGMERLEAREVLKRGGWLRITAGQRIADSAELHEHVYLLVEGRCSLLQSKTNASDQLRMVNTKQQEQLQQQQLQQQKETTLCARGTIASKGETVMALKQLRSFALQDSSLLEEGQADPINHITAGGLVGAGTSSGDCESVTIDLSDQLSPDAPADTSDSQDQQAGASSDTLLSQKRSTGEYDERLKYSGGVINMAALNMFGVYIGFDQDSGRNLEVWADRDCILYSWPMSAMEEMATRCSPSLAAYWRNFITYSLASEFELLAHKDTAKHRCSTGDCEPEVYLQGCRSRDFTDALRPDEQPEGFSWTRLRGWLRRALSPFPPKGLRHTALPTSGVMARNRVLAVAAQRAHAAAARQANKVQAGSREDPDHLSHHTSQLHNDPSLEPLLAKLPIT